MKQIIVKYDIGEHDVVNLGGKSGFRFAFALVASAIAVTFAPAAAQPARPLTIEKIGSAPYPFAMVAQPGGDSVAWVFNDKGSRNIWVAERGPGDRYVARQVTRYVGDDGIDISDLAWTGDGKTLVYTRGGDGRGMTPVNPTSHPAGPKPGALWAVAAAGGAPAPLADGQLPVPAPRGTAVAFVRDGQPMLVAAPGAAATPLFRDRGRIGAMTWSPDASRIAFVSQRPDHSLVGIFDLGAKTVTWLAPGIDRDQMPAWSSDGSRVAFVRVPGGPTRLQGLNRVGTPWQILVADPRTGAGRTVWTAAPGAGSVFRALFNSDTSLLWASGDRLVFPWEQGGWVQLHALSLATGATTPLTTGRSEVFAAQLAPDGNSVVYASNHDDIDRRHLWQVAVAGGAPRQLAATRGIEDFPVVTASGAVMAVAGEARRPLRPVRIERGRLVDLAPQAMPADWPTERLVEPQLVTFRAADGVEVHGQLFVPNGLTGKASALLFFHGGPTNRQTFAAWDSFETHSHLYEANQYLAAHGYVVLSINYRGGAGYGLDFREAKGFGATGASELNDIIGGARFLQQHPRVDAKRLGVWGGSYGGRMTSLALARAPEYFVAGADYAGVHDMSGYYLRNNSGDAAAIALARDSSAIGHVATWRAPVLLMVADADNLTPDTLLLAAALRAKGIPVDQLMIPDEVHFLLHHQSWNTIFNATRTYLDRHLKP